MQRLDLPNSRDSSSGSRYLEMGSISSTDIAFKQEKPETTDRELGMVSGFFFTFQNQIIKMSMMQDKI